MKNRFFPVLLTLLCGLVFPEVYGETKVHYTETARPGGVIVLTIPEDGIFWDGSAELTDGSGNVLSDTEMFTYYNNDLEKTCYTFITGIPTTIHPGEYTLEYSLEGLSVIRNTFPVTITEQEFLFEDIPLTRDLTAIRAEPDPKKAEEAREMMEILNRFSKSAVFSLQTHSLPLEDFIRTSFFGDRRRYLYDDGGIAHSIHAGIDMAAPEGTPVRASGDGKVVFSGPRIITGNSVILEHLPGVYGIYFHLEELSVQSGDYVARGDIIGTVGSTGLSTGNHLHWEMRVGETAVDPQIFLDGNVLDKGAVLGNHISN